jgi:shikimate kinase
MREQIVPGILGYPCRSNEMRRIVLTGFRGTGKTEIGKILSSRLNVPVTDTDNLIETLTGRSIPDIFHEDGEERFRTIEREVIKSVPATDAIVSTGGGVVCDPKNMEYLRRDSTVVLLSADIDTIEKRLLKKPRPPRSLTEERDCGDAGPSEATVPCFFRFLHRYQRDFTGRCR